MTTAPTRILLEVPGDPAGQPRMRHRVVAPRGRKPFATGYTPETADGWKRRVYLAALGKVPAKHLGPVVCNVTWYFRRPGRLLKSGAPPGRIPYTAKPDRDNLDKAVLDALTDAGVWRDDAQVYDGRIRKFYVALGMAPGARIEIVLEHAEGALFE